MKKSFQLQKTIAVPLPVAYQVVAEVEKYPEFIPQVKRVELISEDGPCKIVSMTIQEGAFNAHLTSQATYKENESISVEQLEGPIKSLKMEWHFQELSESQQSEKKLTEVILTVHWETASHLVGHFFSKGIKRVSQSIIDAFAWRAEQVTTIVGRSA
ncbi:MAG: hypothetical protein ONB05_01895 [candidate division KSB1 bacterium]|nr:hypothetical protein [candidate division KSB1 bacterium]